MNQYGADLTGLVGYQKARMSKAQAWCGLQSIMATGQQQPGKDIGIDMRGTPVFTGAKQTRTHIDFISMHNAHTGIDADHLQSLSPGVLIFVTCKVAGVQLTLLSLKRLWRSWLSGVHTMRSYG